MKSKVLRVLIPLAVLVLAPVGADAQKAYDRQVSPSLPPVSVILKQVRELAKPIPLECFQPCGSRCLSLRPSAVQTDPWRQHCDLACTLGCTDEICSPCRLKAFSKKSCRVGEIVLTLDCHEPTDLSCGECFFVFFEHQICCRGSYCWTQGCSTGPGFPAATGISVPLPPPSFLPPRGGADDP